MTKSHWFAASAVLGVALCSPQSARAAIIAVDLGTGVPPATLGPFTMTPFPLDPRMPLGANVTTVPSPLGGDVGFSDPLSHRRIGAGWATWSNGYTGDVYADFGAQKVTLTLPAGTEAFYLYVEPQQFASFAVTVDAGNG